MDQRQLQTSNELMEQAAARPKARSMFDSPRSPRPADVFPGRMVRMASHDRFWVGVESWLALGCSCAIKADAALGRPQSMNDSPALSRAGQGRAGEGRAGAFFAVSAPRCCCCCCCCCTTLPSLTTLHPPDITINGSARVSINILTSTSSTSSPCCRRTSPSSNAAHRRRCTHFVTDLSLSRSANVTRPPRILQANRTGWLHTPVIFSASSPSTPFHPPQLPPRPAAQAATTRSTRFNPGLALLPPSSRLDPSDPSDSLPHTLTTRTTPVLTLSLTPPRRQTTPCLLRTTPLRPAFRLKISPPSCRRSSPQTKCWNLDLTSQRNHVRLRRCCRLGIPDAVALLQGMLLSGTRSYVCQ
jgi:hypothetical protein